MRMSLITGTVGLGLLALAGCSVNTAPPAVATPAVAVTPPTTTYVAPAAVVPTPGTTVITRP